MDDLKEKAELERPLVYSADKQKIQTDKLQWALQIPKGINLKDLPRLDHNTTDLEQNVQESKSRPVKRLFFSYAKEDRDKLDILLNKFDQLRWNGHVYLWFDERLEHDEGWNEQIQENLRHCDAVIVLLSDHFFHHSKDYIHEREVPLILQRHQQEGLSVFPVLMTHSTKSDFIDSPLASIPLVDKDFCLEACARPEEGMARVKDYIKEKLGIGRR